MFLEIFALLIIIIIVAGTAVYEIVRSQGASRLGWCVLGLDVLVAILHRTLFNG